MSKKPENARKSASTQILTLPIGEIRPYEKNPRKNEKAVKYVKESIAQFGFKVPIVIDSNRVIVCGHTRLLAAKSLGLTEVPCIMADDLTDDQIKAFRLADNKVGEFAEWDLDLLGDELNAIADASDIDMGDFGFDLSDDDEETEVVEDEVPEEVEPVCKKGEIWLLGEHRMMCGDSTSADDVAKLMNGERADLVFTDPPYGMGLDTDYSDMENENSTLGKKKGKRYAAGHVDTFTPELITTVFKNFGYCKEIFLWGADYYAEMLENKNEGSWTVWDKRSNEWDKDTTETFDKMFGSCFELCWSKAKHKRDIARVKWAGVYGTETEFDKKRFHPTQKPIKLIKYFLSRYAKENEVIVDLYGGSGSTLIAAEELDMRARVMELDPHYCDVIIARWEKLTGKKAVKVEE